MDLSLVMEQRREIDRLKTELGQLQGQYLQQQQELQEMGQHMRDLQMQLLVIIHSRPDHQVTVTEADYDNLPAKVVPFQEVHEDGSYTITVKQEGPDAEHH